MIMGVKQTMRFVAIGCIFEILFVDRGNLFVVGRGAELEVRVVTIEAGRTHRDDLVGHKHVGLASAVDATAGARHDFDDMIFLLARANHIANLADVGKAKDLAKIELDAGDFDFDFADAFGTTEGFEIEVFGFLAGEFFGCETNDSFGHTAGCAVNDASAAFETHRIVASFVGQAVEVDAEFADEVGQFCGRHRDVDVADAVMAEFFAGNFEFLGRAGHDGNDEDVLVVFADLFGQHAAEEGGAHFLRGFAAGEMTEHILLIFFGVFDPCGAARREDREILTLGHAAEDFGAFFDRREVGGKCRIADEVEAEAMHRSDHFTHDRRAGLEAEFFAEADADGGSDLGDHKFVGIMDSGHNLIIVAVADDGAGRANGSALTAVHAIDFANRHTHRGLNDRIETTFREIENADALDFGASTHAVAAENAFARIANERRRGFVDLAFVTNFEIRHMLNAIAASEFLETAFAALRAGCAIDVVVGEEELQRGLAHIADRVGIGLDDHAITGSKRAAGDDAQTFAFDEAHTACAENGQARMIAKRGDVYAVIAGELKHILLAINGIRTAIDNDFIFHRLSSFNCAKFA